MSNKASDTQVGGGHYRDLPMQPAEYSQRNKLGWLEGTVVKYVTRHQKKGGARDIRKAIHCLELILEYEYGTMLSTEDESSALTPCCEISLIPKEDH